MAKPIKETPVLTGRDAARFRSEKAKVESGQSGQISSEQRSQMKKDYDFLMSIYKA